MKLPSILGLLLAPCLLLPLAGCNIIKFLDDCTTHCKKVHTKFGHLHDNEVNPTKVKHTAEDIALNARCRLAEVIRPKSTSEIGNI